jgi:hypothetical protein
VKFSKATSALYQFWQYDYVKLVFHFPKWKSYNSFESFFHENVLVKHELSLQPEDLLKNS